MPPGRVERRPGWPYNSALVIAGIAQLVERNLAKVEVGSSRLLSRSRFHRGEPLGALSFCTKPSAGWQSGHAAACKAVYAGSIPTSASKLHYESSAAPAPTCRFATTAALDSASSASVKFDRDCSQKTGAPAPSLESSRGRRPSLHHRSCHSRPDELARLYFRGIRAVWCRHVRCSASFIVRGRRALDGERGYVRDQA